jgi:hypothetical protein
LAGCGGGCDGYDVGVAGGGAAADDDDGDCSCFVGDAGDFDDDDDDNDYEDYDADGC